MKEILFLVDIQNLYSSVKSYYGLEYRIDFKIVLDIVKRENHVYTAIVYIPKYQHKNNIALKKAFINLGYEVKIHTKTILEDTVRDNYEKYDIIIIASGNGIYINLYKFLKEHKKQIEVISYGNAINSKIPPIVDKLHLLNRDSLFSMKNKQEVNNN